MAHTKRYNQFSIFFNILTSQPVKIFHVFVYSGLLACLSRPAMNEIYLLTISYVVFSTFVMIEIAFAVTSVYR